MNENVPSDDLFLSPAHAVLIDGNLIPIRYLVNGTTITQGNIDGEVIEYWHVELEEHEVMFAEGLAVETFQPLEAPGRRRIVERQMKEFGDLKPSFAPLLGYYNGRQEGMALVRSVVSRVIDVRDPIQRAYDQVVARAVFPS